MEGCLTLKRTARLLFGARDHRELLASALRQRRTANLDRHPQVTAMTATHGSALSTTLVKVDRSSRRESKGQVIFGALHWIGQHAYAHDRLLVRPKQP